MCMTILHFLYFIDFGDQYQLHFTDHVGGRNLFFKSLPPSPTVRIYWPGLLNVIDSILKGIQFTNSEFNSNPKFPFIY